MNQASADTGLLFPMHVYEVRPRKDKRGFDLISDALPFGRLWYTKPDDAVEYAKFFSRSRHHVSGAKSTKT